MRLNYKYLGTLNIGMFLSAIFCQSSFRVFLYISCPLYFVVALIIDSRLEYQYIKHMEDMTNEIDDLYLLTSIVSIVIYRAMIVAMIALLTRLFFK